MLSVTLSTAILGTVLAAAQDAVGDVVTSSLAIRANELNDGMWIPNSSLLSGIDDGQWSTDSDFLNPTTTTFTDDSNTVDSTDSTKESTASDDSSAEDEHLSENNDIEHGKNLGQIYCPKKNCNKERDWLTKMPNAATGWTLGAISLIISLVTFRYSRGSEDYKYFLPASGTGMLLLSISLFLRASLGESNGDKESIYIASLIFNYAAGLLLLSALHTRVGALKTLFQPPTTREKFVSIAIRQIAFWCPVILFIVGVIYSFELKESYSAATGLHCIQAALVFILAVVFVVLCLIAWRSKHVIKMITKKSIASALAFAFLLLLWGSYMLSRAFVDLDNPARTSEAMYELLNHVPLIACGILGLVFGQPLEHVVEQN
ncbi:hypothetical protein COEREDRAFT_88336 [Coemansia reversa NRRL 1564]|uniref:G-protein coupled receptors family 3 profile domain-containing protein n=1 Tax=Coemansia reversa (strain ATCC 12441 / NRRL 1564) TaxID=763665 RepID=A0A2G5B717_COERN|nr:hypothetical protein COEREDRAFT_88336 [Coemansia reversa NRRL 1564]|eukprot:PIA14805.1 hypothetical protein COEREDRAFT_88336 [Coemansia reversa NRRL 1564]